MKKNIAIFILFIICRTTKAQIINSVGMYAYNNFYFSNNNKFTSNLNYDILNFGLKSEMKISKRFSLVCNPMFNDFRAYTNRKGYIKLLYSTALDTFYIRNSRDIQINFGIKYNIINRKKIKLYSYLCSYVITYNQIKISRMVHSNIVNIQENSFKNTNQYFGNLNVGIGCRYFIKPRLSIDLEPLVNTPFCTNFQEGLPSFFNYTSLGIGINYHFIKK